MAFLQRIQALYGKTLGEAGVTPLSTDANQFMIDGQWDIINKTRKSSPELVSLFTTTVVETAADADFAGTDTGGIGHIVEAVLEPDITANPKQMVQMREITYGQSLAFTTNASLHSPGLFSPVFYIKAGKAFTLPRPAAGKTAKATFSRIAVDTTINVVNDTDLDFPDDYINLVVLYASAKCVSYSMGRIEVNTIEAPLKPVMEGFDSVSESLPTIEYISPFVMPNLDLESDIDLSSLTIPSMGATSPPEAPDFASIGQITVSSINYPEYESPVTAPLYSDAESLLEDEDIELVDARMKIISGQLNEYKLDLDKAKSKFAVGTSKYQAELKKAVIDGQAELARETKEYEDRLKLYQINVQQTASEYEKSLQGYVQEAGIMLKEYSAKSGVDLKKYESELQAEAVRAKSEVTRVQSKFARDMKKYEGDLQTIQLRNKDKLQKFMMEMQLYSQEYNAIIKENQASNQAKQLEYTWFANRFQQLMGEYYSFFKMPSRATQIQQQRKRGQ